MKKLSIFSILFLLLAGNAWAKFSADPFEIPFYETPKEQKYANYQTYSLYAFSPQTAGYSIDGYYRAINERILKEDQNNADFKMIFDVSSIVNPGISVKKDTALVKAQSVTATLVVFDKAGDEVYRKQYIMNAPSAFLLGDYSKEPKEALQTPLMQKLIEYVASAHAREFTDQYLLKVSKPSSVFKAPYIGTVFAFKTTEQVQEVYDKVAELTAADNPADLLDIAQNQMEYWNRLADLPDDKENSDFRTAGIYNSAFLYYIVGERAKSDEYIARLNNPPGYLIKNFNSFKESYSPDKFQKPVLAGPFAHDASMQSVVNTMELADNLRYFVIKNAEVTLSDGTVYRGTAKISRDNKNASQGNIMNLNAADYAVVVEQEDGSKTTTVLSKIANIKSPDGTFAIVKKELYVAKVTGNRVSVFERTVPNDIVLHLYQKPGGELEGTPIFGKGKWLKKYFSDCPALVAKIDKNELKEPVEIGKFYNECQ